MLFYTQYQHGIPLLARTQQEVVMTAELNLSQLPRRVQEFLLEAATQFYGVVVDVTREKGDYYVIVVAREEDWGYWEGEHYMPDTWTEFYTAVVKYVGRRQPVEVCWETPEML